MHCHMQEVTVLQRHGGDATRESCTTTAPDGKFLSYVLYKVLKWELYKNEILIYLEFSMTLLHDSG